MQFQCVWVRSPFKKKKNLFFSRKDALVVTVHIGHTHGIGQTGREASCWPCGQSCLPPRRRAPIPPTNGSQSSGSFSSILLRPHGFALLASTGKVDNKNRRLKFIQSLETGPLKSPFESDDVPKMIDKPLALNLSLFNSLKNKNSGSVRKEVTT